MKRVKAACICQTLHFLPKEDVEHNYAVKLVREEVAHYKATISATAVTVSAGLRMSAAWILAAGSRNIW